MKNPFIQHEKYTNARKRNAFDLSFQNNLSLKIGCETPVLVKEALPGDSFRIKAGAFLRAWPTVFPVQTPIRMNLYLFKVYNRTLQDNFTDMVYNNDASIVHPYLEQPSSFYDVGSLADYMGVPVSYYNGDVQSSSLASNPAFYARIENTESSLPSFTGNTIGSSLPNEGVTDSHFLLLVNNNGYYNYARIKSLTSLVLRFGGNFPEPSGITDRYLYRLVLYRSFRPDSPASSSVWEPVFSENDFHTFVSASSGSSLIISPDVNKLIVAVNSAPERTTQYADFRFAFGVEIINASRMTVSAVSIRVNQDYSYSSGISIADGVYNPFQSHGSGQQTTPPDIKINALPFRAYEACHNSFFRDPLNDPWYLDGRPQYNRYVTNKGDGADSTDYHLFYRNWEKDFLTSAYPSPQQGLAPLVGITSNGRMTFEMDDGSTREVQATFADDNETIVGFKMSKDVAEDPVLRASVMDVVSQGISINNLRDVGALQRWLEANQRGRLRYRDQVYSHTGVKIDYDELDMPEFVGGYSRVVNTAQINNTSAQGDAPLGAFGGQLSFFNGMEHSVTTFFKEHGWLIGILTITPVPAYSQLLPKQLMKDNPLSYFNPEFAHVGLQPITYKEVCPLQIHDQVVPEGGTAITYNDTFGYQRPWYDLIASVDEVHGLMRTSMRDFIMNRTFDGVPYLNADFLHVDPKQVNQVFSYTDGTNDTFFGQIVFDITKKTQIPRSGIPMLQA